MYAAAAILPGTGSLRFSWLLLRVDMGLAQKVTSSKYWLMCGCHCTITQFQQPLGVKDQLVSCCERKQMVFVMRVSDLNRAGLYFNEVSGCQVQAGA